MNHVGVILLLDGPLQSWGTQSKFGHRDTDFEPSKSGVLGLVGSALGMGRDDKAMLERLAELSMAVRVDREGRVLRDYHTAGGGTFRGKPHNVYGVDTVVTQRFYLMDACFVVALSGADSDLVDQIAEALQNPRWPLFLGRRSCVPTSPVLLAGPSPGIAAQLLKSVPLQTKLRDNETEPRTRLRMIVEDVAGKPRNDVPRDFSLYSRAFDSRTVQDGWLLLSELPGASNVSESTVAQPALT
jgi:CRISPR system Cascade subunit CasD